jgi:hypothetical protein
MRFGAGHGWSLIVPGGGVSTRTSRAGVRRRGSPDGESEEQALNLVAGQRDQAVRSWPVGVFVGADDGAEGIGQDASEPQRMQDG